VAYDRIAGYFRSSLFEVRRRSAGGRIGQSPNHLQLGYRSQDMATAVAAQAAMRKSWCSGHPEAAPPSALPRYQALHKALVSGKLEVRVLPDAAFGLIHGKAGVIRRSDGTATAFLGSVNESSSAWKMNYELLGRMPPPRPWPGCRRNSTLSGMITGRRTSRCVPSSGETSSASSNARSSIPEVAQSVDANAAAASAAVETPVYRREQGLWPHQKYFARLALERHRLGGARLVLADQVGLGKTIQLAMAALLMALEEPSGGPVLVLAPKPLLRQCWQGELMELLQLPSARWTGSSRLDR
jgi:hypothetical protein